MAEPPRESTTPLLLRAREGDAEALERLCERYLPRLRRWARGRLPAWARDEADTDDIVQDTFLRTIRHVETIQAHGGAGFQAYVRRVLANRIEDVIRRARGRPPIESLNSSLRDEDRSPLEQAVTREAFGRYEAALDRLDEADRAAIVARLEMGFSYDEIATDLGKPSANAARMTVNRALERLIEEMGRDRSS
jgi:RNA polymerase sigma-70 factor (ECF subfamily)